MTSNNTRRLAAIFEVSMKTHTQERIFDLMDRQLIHPSDYAIEPSDMWYELPERIFDHTYTSRNIFATPDLLIRSLNFIKETELLNYGNLLSYQEPDEIYNVDNICRNTAYYLAEFDMNYQFINWVKECFIAERDDDIEIIEIIPPRQ